MSNLVVNQNGDFLDLLRDLNGANINLEPQKRDDFFRCLYPYKTIPHYQNNYSDSLFVGFIMEKIENLINHSSDTNLKGKADKVFDEVENQVIDSFKFCSYVIRKFGKDNTYYIDNDPNFLMSGFFNEFAIEWSANIEIIRYLIEKIDPSYFDKFKSEFIEALAFGLCTLYNNDTFTGIRKKYEREEYLILINKVLAIYGEEKGFFKIGNVIPQIIDDEFLSQLEEINVLENLNTNTAYNKILEIINNLLERKKLGSRGK